MTGQSKAGPDCAFENGGDLHSGPCAVGALISRREALAGLTATLSFWGSAPRAWARSADPRLLTVVLRGGLDGLAVVVPTADPDHARLRGALAQQSGGAPLGDGFMLHPALPFLGGLYAKGQALVAHATATPYRGRSHFDGQDVLESGLPGVGAARDGWLNRALGALEPRSGVAAKGLSLASVTPLLMRGAAPVVSWTPAAIEDEIDGDLAARLADLYAQTDPALAAALADGEALEDLAVGGMAGGGMAGGGMAGGGMAGGGRRGPRRARQLKEACLAAARLLSAPDGPRLGALSVSGWDTHANAGVNGGALHRRLKTLDDSLRAFAGRLGPVWDETVVLLITEFGRTASGNGSGGTDHGVGGVAMLLGGGVRGGRVLTDWPGLRPQDLFQGRDLRPTLDLRAVLKGVLHEHLGVSPRALSEIVFPDSADLPPQRDLLM